VLLSFGQAGRSRSRALLRLHMFTGQAAPKRRRFTRAGPVTTPPKRERLARRAIRAGHGTRGLGILA